MYHQRTDFWDCGKSVLGFSRLGIGTKLLLAFIGVTAVSLSSGIAGWLVLTEVSKAQTRLSSEALPAVAATRRAADATARLVAAALSLTDAENETQRADQEEKLSALTLEIDHSAAAAVSSSLLDKEAAAQLNRSLDLLVSNLSRQNRLVREKLVIQEQFNRRSQATISAGTAIVDLSETLVSNASAGASAVIANLYGLIEDRTRSIETYDALDRLIEQDLYLLDRMWELRLRSSQIALLVNRLARAIEPQEVTEIETRAVDHLRVVRRRVASIDDPVRRAEASRQLQMLSGPISASPRGRSLFDEKMRLISISDELDKVAKSNRELSAEVGLIAEAMFVNAEAFARDAALQVDRAVRGLNALLLISIVAIMISGTLVWAFVQRGIVSRLRRLTNAMERLSAGDLDVEVKDEGAAELQALSNAVRAFRDESSQRRALETEREETNEALRRHREELQQLVGERTSQLQEANLLLQSEVSYHAQARDLAESANRAKSIFLATMSHEIRTPMTGMLGMLRVLDDSERAPARKRQLAVAVGAGQALLSILNSILDHSKIESGMSGLDPVSFRLRDTLAGIVELMRPSAAEKGLWMEFSCDDAIWPRHKGDAGKLNQIVFNLVNNAIKFTQRGRIDIVVSVVHSTDDMQTIEIAVSDTGIGISAADLDRIFEPFTQTDPSITRRFGGTGLGLAISRRFTEMMGGTLNVRSEAGHASTFTLAVPLARADAELQPGIAAGHDDDTGSLNILVVEDDEATRLVARSFLERLGHKVKLVADGFKALETLKDFTPDLVLMDISLPGIDGTETMRRMRLLDGAGKLPVVAMSAHVFKADVERYLATGMNGYVAKPLMPETLQAAIEQVMQGKTARAYPESLDLRAFDADLASLGGVSMGRILDAAEKAIPQRFEQIRSNVAQGSTERVAALAHATRSSAASAGFQALYVSAGMLETAAKSDDMEGAMRHLQDCELAYRSAMRKARALVEAQMPA